MVRRKVWIVHIHQNLIPILNLSPLILNLFPLILNLFPLILSPSKDHPEPVKYAQSVACR